jgi:hypothetical protein
MALSSFRQELANGLRVLPRVGADRAETKAMSAAGLARRPEIGLRISAQADYRRSDFIFPRTQSLAFRDMPWEGRLRPRRSWGEIGTYAVIFCAGSVLMTTLI